MVSLLWAAPAGAFTPPELYVRLSHANSIDHAPVSGWVPLSAAPRLNWLGGYEIGYKFQASPVPGNVQHAALQVTGVPDGHPTQPLNTPYCLGGPGTVGAIVPVGVTLQFEGSGVYTVRVSVGPSSGGANDCMAVGPSNASSTGSFTVDVRVAPVVLGSPLIFRAKRLAGDPFVGVRAAPAPPGGDADTRCARDATIRPDGSVTGPLLAPAATAVPAPQISEADFGRPGAWTCVARGSVEGNDDMLENLIFGTPWSAPLRFDVRSDFERATGKLSKPRAKRPLLRLTAEFPEVAGGGTGTLKVKRLVRCRGSRSVFKKVGTFKGRFDAKGVKLKLRRPSMGYYVGTLSFSGTHFYTRSVDPGLVLLQVSKRRRLSFVPSQLFPQCPGLG